MGTILPCLLGVLALLDRIAVRLALVGSECVLGLMWYIWHGAALRKFVSFGVTVLLRGIPAPKWSWEDNCNAQLPPIL